MEAVVESKWVKIDTQMFNKNLIFLYIIYTHLDLRAFHPPKVITEI